MDKKHLELMEKISKNYEKYLISFIAVSVLIVLAFIVYGVIVS